MCVVSCVGQSVSNQGVSIRLRVYGYACVCVCDGDGEQVDRELDRELDRDHRDHGVRELDALRLQDGYLLCVMDCFVVVVGLRVYGYACVCVCDGDGVP